VKIIIDNLEGTDYVELEREIENRYGLREVIVVDEKKDMDDQKNEIGKATAQYLERVVKDDNIVGVSMGTTLGHIAKYIVSNTTKNLTFVPLIGGMGHLRMELHSNFLVEDLAKVFNGHFMLMHAPARVSGKLIKDELLKEEGISKIIKMGDCLDVALVGIGVPNSTSAIMATGYYNRVEMDKMREKDVAGDICMQFYDINGSTTPFKVDNNVVGIEIKKLRRVPHS
ncbi:MAG: sugar-binding domain-containing protein, partial [Eubacterium sp.]